ncbi:MAG: RNA pyrophosphohydrolase [Spongiibacter sp.]|uniref:RNA pyrophosphohydrolase n=1 Tax=Spongiibacter thalassae TaxID=2721624 RepID=A0ABX1GHS0_9GAMM|nr:RNA pyrophosphohydrolase [Spongiibacter sp.]NKI18769.1 RNA pyrophosphohydrolase [Spongiibacter thalassae]
MIDSDGFRPNVGIVIANEHGQVLWARRVGQSAWQFPQGGINDGETAEQALFRELYEEVGLREHEVEVLACTRGWLRYRLPKRLIRHDNKPLCIGQKQKWFLLRMVGDENNIRFNCGAKAEFDHWQWVSYWYPLGQVVAFKREVYRRAMKELASRHVRLVRECQQEGVT